MKKIKLNIFCLFSMLFVTNLLWGQKSDSLKNPFIEQNHSFSLSLTTSLLIHTSNIIENKDFISFPTGIVLTFKPYVKGRIGISTGLLFDSKKYNFYKYTDVPNPSSIEFDYNYVYIPIHLNYYFKKTYFSIGLMYRRPFLFPPKYKIYAKYSLPNPYLGFLMGLVVKEVPFKNKNFSLLMEPFLIYTGKYNDYFGHLNYGGSTKSSGLLINICIKIKFL